MPRPLRIELPGAIYHVTSRGNARRNIFRNPGAGLSFCPLLVDGADVSPDGCTIVYANNDFNPKTTEYVQAIDLCASAKK